MVHVFPALQVEAVLVHGNVMILGAVNIQHITEVYLPSDFKLSRIVALFGVSELTF